MAEANGCQASMERSLEQAYRAVAFDIDGTLTPPGRTQLDEAATALVGRLLARGVPVILVTGRGRSGANDTLTTLRQDKQVSAQYLKRLTIIADNGATLFRVLVEDEVQLSEPEDISPAFPNKDLVIVEIQKLLEALAYVEVVPKERTIRVVAKTADEAEREHVLARLNDAKTVLEDISGSKIFIESGTYGNHLGINISRTHKGLALTNVLDDIGIPPEKILRIGDQWHEGGNDYHLLDSPAGFSVGTVSKSHEGCFPVFDERGTQIKGPEATRMLLRSARIMPPLSLMDTAVRSKADQIVRSEGLARSRSRLEMRRLQRTMLSRLRTLCVFTTGQLAFRDERCDDFFDTKSGAVVLYEHELVEASPEEPHPALRHPNPILRGV